MNKFRSNSLVKLSALLLSFLVIAASLPFLMYGALAADTPYAIQVSRSGSVNGSPIDYSGFDWSILGENLVPDPTVSHFDVGGEYGRYANMDSNYNPVDINEYYWWDKPSEPQNGFTKYYKDLLYEHNLQGGLAGLTTDEHGHYVFEAGKSYGNTSKHTSGAQYQVDGEEYFVALRSPLNWSAVRKPTSEYSSITSDGSGVLRFNPPSSGGAFRHIPFPKMEAGKYYVIKFNVKCTTSNSGGINLYLDDTTFSDDTKESFVSMGDNFAANGKVNVVCFLIYTGSKTYENPLASIYLMAGTEVFFDDFGMYEVTAEYAAGCSEGQKLSDADPNLDPNPYGIQTSIDSNNKVNDYTGFDWSYLGSNLIPDPTVASFDNGVYGKYAVPDADYNPTDINEHYWWDRYTNKYHGFQMYYQDMADGSFDKNVGGAAYDTTYISPANLGFVKSPDNADYKSLTEDGSGVIVVNTKGSRYLPLPTMEKYSYYVIKFNARFNAEVFSNDFGIYSKASSGTQLVNFNPKNVLANGKTDTFVCLVYTGNNKYSNAVFSMYANSGDEFYFDDFGMYKVTETFAKSCAEGKSFAEYNPNLNDTPEGFQASIDSSNKAIKYTGFDWTSLGANLIPDPTVASFDNGVYGKYAVPDADYNPTDINEHYWWDRYTNKYHGFQMYYQDMADGSFDKNVGGAAYDTTYISPANLGFVKSPDNADYKSLTEDGSGVIVVNTKGSRYLPLPTMEKYTYYVIKFNAKFNAEVFSNDFGVYSKANSGTQLVNLNPKNILANGKTDTFVCLIYTGNKKYSDPVLGMYVNSGNEFYFDDFGMYKVTETFAKSCAEGMKLTELNPSLSDTKTIAQTVLDGSGKVIDYSDYKWSNYGENLVPDPTVNNFVDDGNGGLVYGRYSKITGYYDPVEINESYWWDKYINVDHGFNLYYKALVDGLGNSKGEKLDLGSADENGYYTIPLGSLGNIKKDENGKYTYNGETVSPGYRSPQNRGAVQSAGSLTNDGSGVLHDSSTSGGYKYYPLSKMEKYTYYLVKFNIKFKAKNWSYDIYLYNNTKAVSDQLLNMAKLGTDNNTATFIVYTGKNTYTDPSIALYLEPDNEVYLDDFGMYVLDRDYAELCIEEGKVLPYSDVDASTCAISTSAVDGYDFGSAENVVVDGSFENSADAQAYDKAKFGSKVLKVKAEKTLSFDVDATSYYLVSFWAKTASGNANMTASLKQGNSYSNIMSSNVSVNDQWAQSTFLLYTSFHKKFSLSLFADKDVYVDGVSVIKLPDTVSSACYAMDTYIDETYDPDSVDIAAPIFGVTNEFSELVSPHLSSGTAVVKYKDLYQKYLELCDELRGVEKGFAPSGKGSRENPKTMTTTEDKNIIANGSCDDESYWKGAATSGSEYIELTDEYSVEGKAIKFTGGKTSSGTAKVYKKRIVGLKENTVYYLRVQGMGLGNVISDADFGFMDVKYGKELENPMDEGKASSNAAYKLTYKQRVNFRCQDGTWYTRVYQFNTENNTQLDFFIRGTCGTVYYDNIMLFKQSDAYTISSSGKIEAMAVLDYSESNFACNPEDNLIKNGDFSSGTEFWDQFVGYNKIVEVATSDEDNKMLHFKGDNMGYYYLPWVNVKADVTYTFSFWQKNLSGKSSRALLVSEFNPHGYASEIHNFTESRGEWILVSVKFVCHEDNRVALGIYDRDGEAAFDNIRFFESSKGYEVSKAVDMPVGGSKFSKTKFGSDGVKYVDDDEDDSSETPTPTEEITIEGDTEYEDYEYDNDQEYEDDDEDEDEATQKVIKKIRRRVVNPNSGLPIWAIILICVGGALVLGGGTFFIIFFLKKKKRKDAEAS